tara:strand:- start:915 stop:1775 length:861 start_codon:yes stop_codon:yes gene_type:complete
MISFEIVQAWLVAFFTLSILSFLIDDNPIYKAAEHLFAGASAGYGVVVAYWEYIRPNLLSKLWPQKSNIEEGSIFIDIWYGIYDVFYNITTLFGAIDPILLTKSGISVGLNSDSSISFSYIIPFILGLLMLMRLIPKLSWMARYSIAYIVGVFAGLRAFSMVQSDILNQIKGFTQLVVVDAFSIISSLVLVIGTICALVYFFFSKQHDGLIGKISKVGIWTLMISFGAAFGYTVMARISLLIGRFDKLIEFSDPKYNYATFWCLAIIVVTLLAYFIIKSKKETEID